MGLGTGEVILFAVALLAATVNSALGYGFSSLTVPIALLFFSNKVLSPALVLVELAINSWVVIMNRQSLPAARRRACRSRSHGVSGPRDGVHFDSG